MAASDFRFGIQPNADFFLTNRRSAIPNLNASSGHLLWQLNAFPLSEAFADPAAREGFILLKPFLL